MKYLDLENWNRKPQFDFFKTFEEPFFGVCVEVECTRAFQKCKSNGWSFFSFYMHCSMLAVNAVENLKYRIDSDDKVVIYDQIHCSSTLNRSDHTFGYSFVEFDENYEAFHANLEAEKARVSRDKSLFPPINSPNAVHYTTLPWVRFTSMSHARKLGIGDSVPKIAFGKLTQIDGKHRLPMSIHVHHALADGYHVSQYIEKFESFMNS